MNDKTKRIILITACCLLCGVAVIGIAGRFGGNTVTPSGTVSGSQPDSNDPNVNINNSQGDVNGLEEGRINGACRYSHTSFVWSG